MSTATTTVTAPPSSINSTTNNTEHKKIHILSMGAGVQTTACLLKYHDTYDDVIFADTGDEPPAVYEYITKYLQPFCKEHNVPWHTVKKDGYDSLMQYCMERKILPIRTRRWCTHEFKIAPIRKYLRDTYKPNFKKGPIIVKDIGFSLDESYRLNRSAGDDPRWMTLNYPLLDDKITRVECYEIIKEHGLPPPPKSACDYCMFKKKSDFRKLALDSPERFAEIVKMEENSYSFPKYTLIGKTGLRGMMEMSGGMDAFLTEDEDEEEVGCDSGHCFT